MLWINIGRIIIGIMLVIHLFTCFWMIFSEKCTLEYIEHYKNLYVNVKAEIAEYTKTNPAKYTDYQFSIPDVKQAYQTF
jgi:hypothetical protein